jgi:hypothetical protein
MADPMTMSFLAQGIGKGGGALGRGWSTYEQLRSQYSEEDEERLKELRRREELGALGLTDAERQRVQSQSLQPLAATEREIYQRQAQGMGVGDVGSGQMARQQAQVAGVLGETKAKAAQQTAQFLQQQDEVRRQMEEEEIKNLEKRKEAKENAFKTAALAALGAESENLMSTVEDAYAYKALKDQQAEQTKMMEAAFKSYAGGEGLSAQDLGVFLTLLGGQNQQGQAQILKALIK